MKMDIYINTHTHTYINWDTKDSVGFSGEEYQMAHT